MASKKDLVEAQSFSRRRLLTAFTSGSVGTVELEPARPLRAVIAGLALTALVVIGGLFYGFLARGLPADWTDNRVILDKSTGARYVSAGSVLYPVANAASARLLIPPSEYAVIATTTDQLKDIPIGQMVGILGAPDQVPGRSGLVNTGWTACLSDDGGADIALHSAPIASPTSSAVVVRDSTGTAFVLLDSYRYQVPAADEAAVLRALGLGSATIARVEDRWINLFTAGSDLTPIVVQGAGDPVEGTSLQIGAVVHQTGDPDDWRYLILSDGSMVQLSPVAYQLYLLGTGTQLGEATDVPASELKDRPNGTSSDVPDDWPSTIPDELDPTARTCAMTVTRHEKTVTVVASSHHTDSVTPFVDAGAGALVKASGHGDQAASTIYLVDATGTAFPIDPTDDAVARLGFDPSTDVGSVDTAWIGMLNVGTELSVSAAGTFISPSPGPTP